MMNHERGRESQTDFPLIAEGISTGYGSQLIINNLSLKIPRGELTVIIGPNACGKSTLLRALARMLPAVEGKVILDDQPIRSYSSRQVACRLGILPQAPTAPEGMVVEDLVGRGRYPHQSLLRQWSTHDEDVVHAAMRRAQVFDLASRTISELSGGQRQRVWLAMALAQETPILLLDEPTTYLDISHQVRVLDLIESLRREGKTIVAVLHELNLAFRYATHLVVMREGQIVAEGTPQEIVTEELIETVYDLPCRVVTDPESHLPLVVPRMGCDIATDGH